MRASASGLSAERFRMDVISTNIANSETTRTKDAEPYRRRDVSLEATPNGVRIRQVVADPSPFPMKYEPGNDAANGDGYVEATNVKPVTEMVNMLSANRAYEANVAAFNTAKSMVHSAMEIGKV